MAETGGGDTFDLAGEFAETISQILGAGSWAAFDEEHQSLAVNLTDMSETDYEDYMKLLQQEGFTVVEETSENIKGQNYISIGTLLSNGEKNLSISYIPGNFGIYISFVE